MPNIFHDVMARRELFLILVGRNMKIRYKNSTLGFFWSLLSPIFLIVIYSIFLGILKIPMPLPVLVSGIIVWQFLAMCLGDSLYAVVGNANLVTKASFPRVILPLSMVGANFINFLLSFVVLVAYLLIAKVSFGALYLLPIAVLTQFVLCLGVASILSAANVFFRDTEHILSVVMLAWFFLSPVIYDLSILSDKFAADHWVHTVVFLNPKAGILTLYRVALLSAECPGVGSLCLSVGIAWAIGVIGVAVFQKAQPRFGDEL
jgi:lipopolysaccharide transport system permease protein